MDGYDYAMLGNDVMKLREAFPFIKIDEFGKSLCGRSLYLLSIGMGDPVLLAGGFHGMEHITSSVLMRLLTETAQRFVRAENIGSLSAEELMKKRKLYFAPCVNPDGVEISLHGARQAGEYAHIVSRFSAGEIRAWQANARGVDLNHNFDAGWLLLRAEEEKMGINGPGPTRFGGFFPHSEPETAALVALCRKKKFKRVMACHSQGEEIYYTYGPQTPPESRFLAERMAFLSGYRATEPEEAVASHGGFKDWFIQETGRMGFTVELGKGRNPLPRCETGEIVRRTREMFFEFMQPNY